MDDFDEPLQAMFADHVDTVYRALDALGEPIRAAVEALCDSMLDERKLLVCGNGVAAALAQAFSAGLLGRAQIDRPGLPVICIGADGVTLNVIEEGYGYVESFSRHIEAIGQSGDTLLLIAGLHASGTLLPAIRSAHARAIRIVAITAGDGGDIASMLGTDDIELRVPADDPRRVSECQFLILNSISALIELRLFAGS